MKTSSRGLFEVFLFSSLVVNAALLAFMAGPLRRVTDDLDLPAFRDFMAFLYRHSISSAFLIIAFNAPAMIAVPYFWLYGFADRWMTAGLTLWLLAGLAAKAHKWPAYRAVNTIPAGDRRRLEAARKRINTGNVLQAAANVGAAILAAMAFVF